jgi:hypothetical protein
MFEIYALGEPNERIILIACADLARFFARLSGSVFGYN